MERPRSGSQGVLVWVDLGGAIRGEVLGHAHRSTQFVDGHLLCRELIGERRRNDVGAAAEDRGATIGFDRKPGTLDTEGLAEVWQRIDLDVTGATNSSAKGTSESPVACCLKARISLTACRASSLCSGSTAQSLSSVSRREESQPSLGSPKLGIASTKRSRLS